MTDSKIPYRLSLWLDEASYWVYQAADGLDGGYGLPGEIGLLGLVGLCFGRANVSLCEHTTRH